jgi:hypothetical protein
MAAYAFKVIYNVKHINKKSALYGMVTFDQTCKFASLREAFRFAREMKNKRTSKIQVIGMPIIERL